MPFSAAGGHMKRSGYILTVCLCLLSCPIFSAGDYPDITPREIYIPELPLSSPNLTYYVSTTGSDMTGTGSISNPWRHIQYAVNHVGNGDLIMIYPGTYEEHVQINSKSLALMSVSYLTDVFIHSDTSRCITALHCPSLFLYHLQFQGQVTTPMQNSGGAVRIEDGSGVLRKCVISNSSAPHNGGGLYAIDAILTIDSCDISNNQAYWGGAPYSGMKNCGGGICYWGDNLSISHSTISGNYCGIADAYGGGVYVNGNGATIRWCDIYGNTAEAFREGVNDGYEAMGGGVYIEGDESYISGSQIYDNTATARTELTGARCFGGGVASFGINSDFLFNLIYGNDVIAEFWEGDSEVHIEAGGGGVYLQGTTCTNNTFDDNHAISNGILNYDYCDITLVAVGGGAILDNNEIYRNIFSFNSIETNLEYNASCQPGCLSFCDRFLVAGAGISQSLGSDNCNIFYGNTGTQEYSGSSSGSKFNVDPQYCDQINHNYLVTTASPALPANNSCGQQIGAKLQGCAPYVFGDANGDSNVNVGDAVYMINYVFKGGPAPDPLEAGDANCDGFPNVADAVYLINYVFKGGPAPGCI